MPSAPATIRLRKGEEKRIRRGHLWIFSNEINTAETPLANFESGQAVTIESARGDRLGTGYINPHSLIAVRICSRDGNALSFAWFRQRIDTALRLRNGQFEEPYYRLIHGEGDFLPGVVVDRFGDLCVVQITTAGMECRRDVLIDALRDVVDPQIVLLRNDAPIRVLEQLPCYRETLLGSLPEQLEIRENGLVYEVATAHGQKTGWFFDHRTNRSLAARLSVGRRVLDCYAYVGAWGINALAAGAREVIAIDASAAANTAGQRNAERNGFSGRYSTITGDVVDILRSMVQAGERFDQVILDPPAFIKRKKDYRAGLRHYELNNRLAASLLTTGGVLVSASCSQPLSDDDLQEAMLSGARRCLLDLQLLHRFEQAIDHPVNAAMPETRYLKGFIGRLESV